MMVRRHAAITSHDLHLSAVIRHAMTHSQIHHTWSWRGSLAIAAAVGQTPHVLLVVCVLLIEYSSSLQTLTCVGGTGARLRSVILRRVHLELLLILLLVLGLLLLASEWVRLLLLLLHLHITAVLTRQSMCKLLLLHVKHLLDLFRVRRR